MPQYNSNVIHSDAWDYWKIFQKVNDEEIYSSMMILFSIDLRIWKLARDRLFFIKKRAADISTIARREFAKEKLMWLLVALLRQTVNIHLGFLYFSSSQSRQDLLCLDLPFELLNEGRFLTVLSVLAKL